MPKHVSSEELQFVANAVTAFPEGASLKQLFAHLGELVPMRTLQRRLATLVAQGGLMSEGKGAGTRYFSRVYSVNSTEPGGVAEPGDEYDERQRILLSAAGRQVQAAVSLPLSKRRKVAYQPQFLQGYRANKTFYLAQSTRKSLAELGRSPDNDRPAGTYARQIYNRLLIDLSWNSSRLEGNTYSLLETERLLQAGDIAEDKDIVETQMLLNHKAAIELLVEQADEIGYNAYTIKNLHALLSENLLPDPQAEGRLRTHAVGIAGSVFQPLDVPQQIEDCFNYFLETANAIDDPIEAAFFVMVHLPYLQAFDDVNKRVSRLAANIPLIRHNYCPLSFVDVADDIYVQALLGVYELNRVDLLVDVFVWAYKRSCARYSQLRQTMGQPDAFRLRYKVAMTQIIREVVLQGMSKKQASAHVRERAQVMVQPNEQMRFREAVEGELLGLHEGNIARYRLRPSEFEAWCVHWLG